MVMMLGNSLIKEIRNSSIGDNNVIHGPYGQRRITYADWSASGRSVSFIEDFITKEVLPMYANTHTETSGTSAQTTRFREDSRAIIAREVNATSEASVIFTGSGSTAAIRKIIGILGISLPQALDKRYALLDRIPPEERPVVFIGPYEHHSNELPWRESIADVVVIPQEDNGYIDLSALETSLKKYRDRSLKIGSFSAASNVTGITSDTAAMTTLLHKYGALAFFDYAAAGPHVKIDFGHKDAIFLSPHKFPGGVGTPGILVVRNNIVNNVVPTTPGGGTVVFVSHHMHKYEAGISHREEGGTPAIVESIRAGLVFQLKAAVGYDTIDKLEDGFLQRCLKAWRADPNIEVLGHPEANRVSIVSFLIRRPGGMLMHYNLVVALLNDLFGIQARGGCACAGPYGHSLLGIDDERSRRLIESIADGWNGIRPGWVRVTFSYCLSDAAANCIIGAVQLIAKFGWALIPQYTFSPTTNVWTHRNAATSAMLSLNDVSYKSGSLQWRSRMKTAPERAIQGYLKEAEVLLQRAARNAKKEQFNEDGSKVSLSFDKLRQFELPSVCLERASPASTPTLRSTPRSTPPNSPSPTVMSFKSKFRPVSIPAPLRQLYMGSKSRRGVVTPKVSEPRLGSNDTDKRIKLERSPDSTSSSVEKVAAYEFAAVPVLAAK